MNTDYNITTMNTTNMRLKKLTTQHIQLRQASLVGYRADHLMVKKSKFASDEVMVMGKNAQAGFTLIELMISLVLGLLIAAAAMQVYVINFKTTTVQQSTSELVDASVFGIQLLESHIRMANMGNDGVEINDNTIGGGVVLTGISLGQYTVDTTTNQKVSNYANTGYLTRSSDDTEKAGTNGWTGASNTDVTSDQLTIQFKNVTGANMPDCEGNDIVPDDIVVERFFLRKSTPTAAADDLVLACDAGRIAVATSTNATTGVETTTYTISDFGGAGQPFLMGVDQFKVLLGIQNMESSATFSQAETMMYLPSNAYNAMTVQDSDGNPVKKPPIISIKLGMVIHGSTAILGSDDQTSFNVLGQTNTLNATAGRKKKMRTTYETSVLLRNARVVNLRKTYKKCYQKVDASGNPLGPCK